VTAGFLSGTTPWSLVLDLAHESGSRNPMVESGTLQSNTGIGTKGLEVSSSQLLTSNFQSGFFGRVRMFPSRAGLLLRLRLPIGLPILRWRAARVFCCAGSISVSDRSDFPAFV